MNSIITEIILYAAGGTLTNLFCIYCWHKLTNRQMPWKSKKLYIGLLILTAIGTAANFVLPQYMKIGLIVLISIFVNLYLLNDKLEIAIITVLISELIGMIGETLIVFSMAVIFMENVALWQDNHLITALINIGIFILGILALKTPLPYKLYNLLVKLFRNMRKNSLILIITITILIACLFMIMSWMDLPIYLVLTFNTIFIVVYVTVIIKLISTESNFQIVRNKYETSLTSLREYEEIMNKYRMDNHENKNQLLMIRNMIKSKDKTVVQYIEKLVEDKIKDNETIFYKTSKIPEGGLRATIYSKLCKMDGLNIKYTLDIANDVKTVDLIKMGDNLMIDICKIIGVFLDNAIEEVIKIRKKEIIIEMFIMDNYLCIDISNNYKQPINAEKIGTEHYTTKGPSRGYGLSLVKKIILKDKRLENKKMINKKMFTQRLKVKM